MICVDELKKAIADRVATYLADDNPLASRSVMDIAINDALNHVLAIDINAAFDMPRQDLSAMDGFALAKNGQLDSGSTFDIIGESCAGKPFVGELLPNQAVRIFTGAVVPSGCDTVVMQENTNFDDIKATLDKSQPYAITLSQAAKLGANIRRQGEEIAQHDRLLTVGKRLNPSDISLLASMGHKTVQVLTPLTVGLIATGDELVAIGQPLTNLAQIYNSNTPTLKALLDKLPVIIKDYGITKDTLADTEHTVKTAITECDVIISSAGVSVGDYDFLTQVVENLGKINHYKVAMRPGKPFVFGEFTDNTGNADNKRTVLYFGLPGNPLSTVVGCINFVRPALWQALGAMDAPKTLRLLAKTTTAIKKNPGRREYQRGYFEQSEQGLVVTPAAAQDSHRIKQLSQANCLIVLDESNAGVKQGEQVAIELFDWVL
ncbi:molybdopterin molybdotransferase MoeA [Moraxella marmotae]|uniref:molybdopterin molybdotransferase MoeA n=1 Tax=Moraxella marmotae TaxID=3344520 RepID=UPI0035F44755